MVNCGALTKCTYGVKILGKGFEKIKELGVPLTIEATDATTQAI